MNGYRTRTMLHDAAEMERKAALARWADHEIYKAFKDQEPEDPTWLQVGALWAAVVAIFVIGGVL